MEKSRFNTSAPVAGAVALRARVLGVVVATRDFVAARAVVVARGCVVWATVFIVRGCIFVVLRADTFFSGVLAVRVVVAPSRGVMVVRSRTDVDPDLLAFLVRDVEVGFCWVALPL